ncbi:MAG: hypothetical protein ACD_20C00175G0003, partial [uncultured bacterium]
MQNEPLVSIVIILSDFFHLASLTLKSIVNQTDKSYEVIVLETAETKKDLIMIKPYLEKIKIVKHFEEADLPLLMNKGLEIAKGKYIHFLFSGDVYVSKFFISYLKDLITKNNFPDLICCSFLKREENLSPEAQSFSLESFRKGEIPMNISSCWLLISTVNQLNGFDAKYRIQSGFDLICKIFLKKNRKIFFSNRVLTDYQVKKKPSSVDLYITWENLKIIYK